ncbi:MerR family transcriptional regulator [soil metagenome]
MTAADRGTAREDAAKLSIGEVLAALRAEFPSVTISKIRYLEAEDLITPERTASGYRKFSQDDVVRLRFVLSAQRDQYLPLRVIKERLSALDRGLQPDSAGGPPRAPRLSAAPGLPDAEDFVSGSSDVRVSVEELCAATGLAGDQVAALMDLRILVPRPAGSGYFDADALMIARTIAEMARFGIEARHLRAYRAAADREIGLFEQVLAPLLHSRGPDASARAEENTRELAALSVRLHATLVKTGLPAAIRR